MPSRSVNSASRLTFPSPGDLPNLGIKPASPVSHCIGRQIICWAIREAVCVGACVCVCVCVYIYIYNYSFYMIFYCCCCSVAQSCLTFCNSMGCSTSGFPVLHHFSELVQTHVHWVNDANQPSHPLSPVLLLPSILPGIRVFSDELALHIRWPK